MTERKLVPHIRFMNFYSEWNTVKLSRLLNVYDGVHQTPTYTKSGVPFVSVENIRNLKTNKYISKNDFDLQFKSSKPACGDLLMTRIGDIGTVNIIKSDGDLAYYVSLALLKPKAKSCKNVRNSYYLMYLVESPRVKKELWKRTLHIAFPKKINKNEISKITICTSSDIGEQQKVGDFFAKLDRLLDLQQQKLDQLELLKKALLQKLFPKQGAKIPELRFKGFEEEWYKDKAINSFKSVSDKHHPNLPILAASQAKGMILRNDLGIDIKYKKSSLDSYKKVQPNQFVIHLMSFEGGIAYSKYKGITSPAYTVLAIREKNNQDPIFWKYSFTRENFIRKLKVISYGVRMGKSISYIDFGKLTLSFPTLTEQQKIGNLLEKVDRLLELENKKSNNLKKVKKFLLQNMFVE